ncbi:hypothetical protein BDN72DRAFT_907268 [Pluteus cervinus]|uniref:Uncharacterized protein n=1 Tax=Pluteus cervinus TaxID=181527 RepID=A0ACD2ZX03_9AGAR|nr:hypothetical protein BDN72DRAFT_907268 [Pluteus cervinus]
MISQGLPASRNSSNILLSAAAHRPDFYSPFRQLAPTLVRALTTIYSDSSRLKTNIGLLNAVCFRGLFYGSQWAQLNLRWIDSLEDWTTYFSSFSRIPHGANKERYFISVNPYGTPNSRRSTQWVADNFRLMEDLEAEDEDWTSFLSTFEESQNYQDLFLYLKRFKGIGQLTALLLIGDLVAAGVIPEPGIQDWCQLISSVSKGAVAGLKKLSLLPPGPLSTSDGNKRVYETFSGLHSAITGQWDAAKQTQVGYNIIMLEHALCKYSRMVKY